MRSKLIFTVFLAGCLLCAFAAEQPSGRLAYQDPNLSPEQRAADLVSRMTLEEKVSQMQNIAAAIPRLGIPAYDWWNEGLHGVARAGRATVFPQAIGLAATWDTDLMHRVADTISTEARAKYNDAIRRGIHTRYRGLTFWSPNINIFRDPRWGRGQETYGEDPFLTSRMAVAFITGMQGDDPHYLKTVATAKHFAVHSGPDPLRHQFDVHPSARDLEHTYLPAFRASVEEGKADSVMCSYNAVDGVPTCASTMLLKDHLRDAWHFGGYVVSDCGAISDIDGGVKWAPTTGHRYASSMEAASVDGVRAGTDLSCGTEYSTLVQAVRDGSISEKEIDQAAIRLFTARFRLGMFDPPGRVPYNRIPYSENDSPAHRQLALQAARESIVLLKNNGVLPLAAKVGRIAIIGPAADDPDTLLGNYNGTPSRSIAPLEGLSREFGRREPIRFALGSTFTIASDALIPPSVFAPPLPKMLPFYPIHVPIVGCREWFAETSPADDECRPSAPRPRHGLYAEYFSNADLGGAPALARFEPRVYLRRDAEDPTLDSKLGNYLDGRPFSVRWTGSIEAPYTGDYKIGVVRLRCETAASTAFPDAFCHQNDSARVFLDGKLLLEASAPSGAARVEQDADIQLESGRSYSLRVEYREQSGGLGMELVWIPPAEPAREEAVRVVKDSDVAIAFLGLNSRLEGEEMPVKLPGFLGGDRTSLDLPEPQKKLLEAVIATGKPVIVVLMSGSALGVNFAEQHAAAILESWYGGEEAGAAIAETIAGKNNPGGRLPVTFYRSVSQLPPFEDYDMMGRTYRYFSGDPLYRFGYGLSYSKFAYSDPQVRTDTATGSVSLSARVKNTSGREGDEVVQLYVNRVHPLAGDPICQLLGFRRIHLNAGEEQTVTFRLKLEDVDTKQPVPRGELHASIGGGQPIMATPRVEFRF